MFRNLFSRTDVFLLFVVFLTFLTSLIMTICNCIKKAIITFTLATILLFFFLKNNGININFHHKNSILRNFSKLLINNPHTSPHQENPPKKTQQHPQVLKIHNHLHAFLSKTIHIFLKKDTHDYLNH